ncbi:MAG TPA: SRPBCC family protein [Polyangiaceae bacterium]|jgi:uncharacterized protein YndB with AHSA1/START domain|nr:SRPBCC family protein [Polyangiaceae bacterium]
MWFQVQPAEIDYTRSSPFQIRHEAQIAAPPERVFDVLSTNEGAKEWFKDFEAIRWTSAPPHGVGSTREVELKLLTAKERFLAWDPGRRLTFCIYALTLPIVTQMVEDMQMEPSGDGGTRFTWTVHYTPSLLMRPVHPIARKVFGDMFRASTEGLRRFASKG